MRLFKLNRIRHVRMISRSAAHPSSGLLHIEQHAMRNLKPGNKRFRFRWKSTDRRWLCPCHEIFIGRPALDDLFSRRCRLARDVYFQSRIPGLAPPPIPASSNPLRPARPLIWWKSRALNIAVFWPSYLPQPGKKDRADGKLMPTPRVSVPQMTLSSPFCASCSTKNAVFRK